MLHRTARIMIVRPRKENRNEKMIVILITFNKNVIKIHVATLEWYALHTCNYFILNVCVYAYVCTSIRTSAQMLVCIQKNKINNNF